MTLVLFFPHGSCCRDFQPKCGPFHGVNLLDDRLATKLVQARRERIRQIGPGS